MNHRTISLFVSTLLLLGAMTGLSAAEPFLEKIDLFEGCTNGVWLPRIPGIVVTAQGTVLAYCEARKNTAGDWGEIEIQLRRSTDGGRHWEPARQIAHRGDRLPRNPMALAQKLGKETDQSVNTPAAIAGRNGTVHLFYTVEYNHCFYLRSTDDGLSFSKPVDITATLEKFRPDYDWKVVGMGPGHGIQLKNGRLVMPLWLSLGTGGGAHRPSIASLIYSDDQGQSWQRGAIAAPDTKEFVYPSEVAVVQLADGPVMFNLRTESAANRRLVVTSPDGATGWSQPHFDAGLPEPICMGSLARLSEKPAADKNRIVFSNPNSLKRDADGKEIPGKSGDRKNLSIRLSYDEAGTWPVTKTLEAEASAYSDLAALADGTILCFYERGRAYGPSPFKHGLLTLARFNLEWLTDGKDSMPIVPAIVR